MPVPTPSSSRWVRYPHLQWYMRHATHNRLCSNSLSAELLYPLAALMADEPFKLVIMDSIAANMRVDYTGRGEPAARLHACLHVLGRVPLDQACVRGWLRRGAVGAAAEAGAVDEPLAQGMTAVAGALIMCRVLRHSLTRCARRCSWRRSSTWLW
jgi:hypothetical protein